MPLGKWSNSRPQLTETIDLCEARVDPGIASFEIFRQMSSHQGQFARRLFASGQSMHQFKDSALSRQPSWIVFVELSGLTGLISKCVVLDIHTVLLDHIGGKPLVLFSEDGLIAFVFST